jgi:hypothetical protein
MNAAIEEAISQLNDATLRPRSFLRIKHGGHSLIRVIRGLFCLYAPALTVRPLVIKPDGRYDVGAG